MGYSLTSVTFCSDEFAISPHTVSNDADLIKRMERKLTLRQFSRNGPARVEKRDDNGEYVFSTPDHRRFAEGPAV